MGLSYNVPNNDKHCSICMAFVTNQVVHWVTAIPIHVKNNTKV